MAGDLDSLNIAKIRLYARCSANTGKTFFSSATCAASVWAINLGHYT